ncbi:MAG: glycosyltransferase family 2 protein [Phycisphaerales bacterium]
MDQTLPKISVVTPCRNGAAFLEQTLASVAMQAYPSLEHVFVDGGSTDGTMAIVERHRDRFAAVVCEPDEGMYDAINKGFARTSGDVMAWLNADDIWLPGTLMAIGRIFATLPDVEWISTAFPAAIDEFGATVKMNRFSGFSRAGFLAGENLAGAGWWSPGYIQQESTFWRRSLWERAGGRVESKLKLAGDFELWARFFRHAELWAVDVPLACWRRHRAQQTSTVFERYVKEAAEVFRAEGGAPIGDRRARMRHAARSFAPPRARPFLTRIGLIEPRPWISYDWVAETWRATRR